MGRTVSTLAAILVLAVVATTAQAAVTVTQDGGDLYVVGDNTNDSVRIFQYSNYGYVQVYDYQTGDYDDYYDVDKVWVDTGNGDDFVDVETWYGFTDHADVCVDTGNGKDRVYIDAYYSGVSIDVSTGNGEDYVYAYTAGGVYYGGEIIIDTGNADDVADLRYCYKGNLDVALGRGDDTISGHTDYCEGTLDGGKGGDSRSGLVVSYGSLSVINFED